jgi:anti-sigma regulatory factor (Ser/Thr protein kinase)
MEIRIYINNDLDVAMARMQTRRMAKKMGFTAADQARISLAVSELAWMLIRQTQEPAQIILSTIQRNMDAGIQIVCRLELERGSPPHQDEDIENFQDKFRQVGQLMDEGMVAVEDEQYSRVTLIKWLR